MFAMQNKQIKSIEGPRAPWLLIVLFLVLMAVAVSFFGGRSEISNETDESIATPSITVESRVPRIYTISYKVGVFSPTNLRIHSGDTIRFKNEGFFPIHIISDGAPGYQDLPGFDSVGDIPQNSYFSLTFSEKGIFGYHNMRQPDENGTIIVR